MKEYKKMTHDELEDLLNSGLSVSDFIHFMGMQLKYQDRDTRHACAELVYSLEGRESPTGGEVLYPDDVHEAIMNCCDGLKL